MLWLHFQRIRPQGLRKLRRHNHPLALHEDHGLKPRHPLFNFDDYLPLHYNPDLCPASTAHQVHLEVLLYKALPLPLFPIPST